MDKWFAENKINEKAGTAPGETCGGIFATTEISDCADNVVSDYKSFIKKDELKSKLLSIKDFLNKPYLVSTVPWAVPGTNIKNYVISSGSIGTLLMGNSVWTNKMAGFGMIRATAVLRLLLNANPFQQGKLLLHFLPNEKDFTLMDASYVAMHNANIAAKRMQPCVELDCSDGGAVFKMPYIAPYNWFDTKTGKNDWGTYYLSVMSPLAVGTGGVSTVDVSIYLHFEDVELSAPMVPQTLSKAPGGPKKKFTARAVGKDLATKELDAMSGGGSLSSALKAGSIVAGKLGEISAMSSLASPATWTLMAAAGLSNYMGWSKPTNNKAETLVSQQYGRYLATSDGVSNCIPLALRSDNALSVSDGYSVYDSDEMSFGFLYKVSTCVYTYTWLATGAGSASGSSIVTKKSFFPRNLYEPGLTSGTTNSSAWGVGPPIFYLSNMFYSWRGSFQVTFKLVKTDYHTGRLQLTWTPTYSGAIAPDLTSGMFALREIIDIKDGNEFTFNLPWMMPRDYLLCTEASGFLDIMILNELRAPDTCSQAIEILVYVSGGNDFELQIPGFVPGTDSRYTMPFSPQTLSENTGDKVILSGPVGGSDHQKHNIDHASRCTGELPMGIKQFLSRSAPVIFKTAVGGNANGFSVWPWHSTVISTTVTTGALTGPATGPDLYTFFSTMYAYYRGGVNITVRNNCAATYVPYPTTIFLTPVDLTANTLPWRNQQVNNATNTVANYLVSGAPIGLQGVAINQSNIGLWSAKVPYQSRTKMSLALHQTGVNGYIPNEVSQPVIMMEATSLGGFTSYEPYRSFADDFQLSYFIGCPPVLITYT
jgi:hypothetical protein